MTHGIYPFPKTNINPGFLRAGWVLLMKGFDWPWLRLKLRRQSTPKDPSRALKNGVQNDSKTVKGLIVIKGPTRSHSNVMFVGKSSGKKPKSSCTCGTTLVNTFMGPAQDVGWNFSVPATSWITLNTIKILRRSPVMTMVSFSVFPVLAKCSGLLLKQKRLKGKLQLLSEIEGRFVALELT